MNYRYAVESVLPKNLGQFLQIHLGVVQFGATDDQRTAPQKTAVKVRISERHAIGSHQQIGFFKVWRIHRNQLKLNRPLPQFRPQSARLRNILGRADRFLPQHHHSRARATGVLDGLLTSSESLVSMRIYEQAKNATVGGKNEIFLLIQPLVMAKSAWDKLTPQQQKAFEEAATISENYFNEEQKKAHADLRKAWEKAGGKVRELSDAEYDAWVALAKKTAWPKFEAEVKGGKSLVQVVQESVQKTN